jgi:short-subunit dehydrogenase
MKTILITGASSGIGKETARYFADRGWMVFASMRNPEKETELTSKENIHLIKLDVTSEESVKNAMSEVLYLCKRLDVLVNNAGYAAAGPFEASDSEIISRQFDVNVFGLMTMTRAAMKHFREMKAGVIINVASVAGHAGFPTFTLYNATKFAVEGFSEALWYEALPFGISVKLVEPGPIRTDFYGRSMDVMTSDNLAAYDSVTGPAMKKMNSMGNKGLKPERVAKTIFKAATGCRKRLRYPVGFQAAAMIRMRHILPNRWFRSVVRLIMK